MKRTLLIVAMLLIAAPAMATVTVTATQTGIVCSNVKVTYNCDGGEKVRAFALEISVDNGFKINAISDFNRGVSTTKAPCIRGYGIFPGKFRDCPINPTDPCWTDPNYDPISANETDTAGTGLGTNKIIVELGSLYSGDPNAPTSSGTLFKLDVIPPHPAMDCNLVLAVNDARGGVVDINGDSFVKDTNLTLAVGGGGKVSFPDCYPCWQPYKDRYDKWVSFSGVSKPDCWCGAYAVDQNCKYQCYGDGNCDGQVVDWRIYSNDLTLLLNNWKKKGTDPTLDPCADFAHDGQVVDWRVYSNDLNVLLANWKKKGTELATFPPCPKP